MELFLLVRLLCDILALFCIVSIVAILCLVFSFTVLLFVLIDDVNLFISPIDGQTGSGKTHTMEGRQDPPELRGVIPNSFQHIFEHIANADGSQHFLVRASYLEIYNEEIRDLLSKDPKNHLDLKENVDSGVYVKDLTSFVVKNATEIDHVMQAGKKNRSVGATLMNQASSRSHSIFTIIIECAESDGRGDHIRVGKLNLVDLAGSERQSKTGATGDRLKEATKINSSLVALGNVISALVDGKSAHIPYRDSKLTRLLQNSLGGNAKTVMCANAGPADYNYDETLSTLRYANRAKNIKNKPKINEDPKDAMLREYQDEIKALKAQLEAAGKGMMINEKGEPVQATNAKREIVEKIVERVKEVKVGVSDEEMEKIKNEAESEKKVLMKQAQDDMKSLIDQQSRTVQEREELQAALDREASDKRKIEDQKEALMDKLKQMEEKLISGGEMMTKASQQEGLLRKAEMELRLKQQQENMLSRELAEKEEANLQLEEHFSSLQEEVEVKTKKLKKLFTKYQQAQQEAIDIKGEFQTERTDLVDTIRHLTRTIKLKDAIIANFVPEESAANLEKRALWNEEMDCWTMSRIDGNGSARTRLLRPVSSNALRRPETDFARSRRQYDTSSRYRGENIISMEFDLPDKTTQDFEGPGMISKLDHILAMSIKSYDPADYIEFPREREERRNGNGSSSNDNSNRSASNGNREGRDGVDYYGNSVGEERKSGDKENRKSKSKSNSRRSVDMEAFDTGDQEEQEAMPVRRSSKSKRSNGSSRRRESERKEYDDYK